MNKARVLVVEDEPILALDLKECLQEQGYAIVGLCNSGEESVALCRTLSPQLVLMDIKLDGLMSGTEAAKIISLELGIPVVFLSSYIDKQSVEQAQAASSYGYLQKPFRPETLSATLQLALVQHERQQQLAMELASLRQQDSHEQVKVFRLSASTRYQRYSGRLIRDGAPVKLTPKEQLFLDLLTAHPDTLLGFEQICLAVWDSPELKINALRTLLHRLRQKAGGATAIKSIVDTGYRLDTETEPEAITPTTIKPEVG